MERTSRCAFSALINCMSTVSWSSDLMRAVPCTSGQALAMPCSPSSLKSAIRSSMAHLPIAPWLISQPVIAVHIGLRWLAQVQMGVHLFVAAGGFLQAREHVQDVLGTHPSGLQGQFHGH